MLFEFLKYLQPTHYFQLLDKNGVSVYPLATKLPDTILNQIVKDSNYQSSQSIDYDLSWQAIQNGYISDITTYSSFEKLPVVDNYRFIRKNFHSAWVFYVLVLRLLSLHNPITEITGWLKTRHVKRMSINPIKQEDNWKQLKSNLLEEAPKVSVIIPTLNRYDYLKDVLRDFEQQDYGNFEIIVVDQSDDFNTSFYADFKLDIQLIRQEEKALWLARNTAIQSSKGELIALSEDDVRIPTDWISSHLKCLEVYGVDISAGVFYPEGQSIPKERSFFAVAYQFATGNAMLYKSVFERVGLFDRQFEKQRMGDGEFGLRVYLEGIKSISNPIASCIDVKAGVGGLREMGSWDAFRPSNFFAPRPIPSVLYFFRRYFGNYRARLALLRTVPISIFPYQFKKNRPLLALGILLSALLLPIVCYQVFRSWYLSTKKINEGPLIPKLK
ncbi:glycosyltransferase family 2 protein [Psychroserpens sp.]|uniref:glycosyltransferase family 2 protein n=1 Tax=Psychroserpens sp. TaxID=2020870 RepID=UPI001B22CBA9|nr:glycosyltransferase [Psychroserpens sp.]MBO6606970.1 glycosyltransferase [Psychroserpens sp.]MBO6630989.1 glycosyltransferase [Psychroserpens sp.]MBO6654116.1 glycosyltransferase [Psychroserpens sp.]MBO6682598.1 glycosyltransferase [Psychroserpens sp.]MBO6750742.1 glycosyltransferase [Psychroserpens sp.]